MAINYSLSPRAVNPGEAESEKKIYPVAQYREIVSLKELAAHLVAHGSPFSRGAVLGILTDTVTCIRENLLLGNKVQLGDMGAFFVTLSSEGADNADNFVPGMIKGVNVRWTPGEEFRSLLDEASFCQVATRELQLISRKEMRNQANVGIGVTGSESGNGGTGGNGGNDNGEGITG